MFPCQRSSGCADVGRVRTMRLSRGALSPLGGAVPQGGCLPALSDGITYAVADVTDRVAVEGTINTEVFQGSIKREFPCVSGPHEPDEPYIWELWDGTG